MLKSVEKINELQEMLRIKIEDKRYEQAKDFNTTQYYNFEAIKRNLVDLEEMERRARQHGLL